MFRRMKRLLRLRNKSGFTLVEVIVACALLGVLVLGIMGFATPVLSGVRAKEQNARAVLLSEAIDTYIANTIQYSRYVVTVDYVASGDTISAGGAEPAVYSLKYNGTEFPKQLGGGLSDMVDLFKNGTFSSVNYEIRCIGVRWLEVPGEGGEKKLMLTNEKVDQLTCALDPAATKPVFESVFYDGLYPVIKLENYQNHAKNPDFDETQPENPITNPKYLDLANEDDLDIAPGLKIVTDVYITPECYDIRDNVRENAMLTFSGMTYADLPTIRSKNMNREGTYKIRPNLNMYTIVDDGKTVPSYSTAQAADAGQSYSDAKSTYYYPSTFIYYIARKTKTGSEVTV